MTKVYSVAVIGGGAAGVMAVNRSVLNNDETLFFPGTGQDKKKSRALWVSKIENMPGLLQYKKGIEEPNREMLSWLSSGEFSHKLYWMKNRGVTSLTQVGEGIFKIVDNKNEEYLAQNIILCTGVMDVQPVIEDSIEPVFPYANAQVIDYCLRCDGHHTLNKKMAIIGHDSSAAWVAVMLYERYQCPSMIILAHGKPTTFSPDVQALLDRYQIKTYGPKIKSIRGDEKIPKLESFILEDGQEVAADMAFVSLGMIVYNELALECGAQVDERGFVTTTKQGESSVPGLFIAGDLRAGIKKQVYTAWDSAVDAADEINRRLRLQRRTSI